MSDPTDNHRLTRMAPMENDGTWPIAKRWPDTGYAQLDGRWFKLAHIGNGCYEIVDGPFGTYQRAVLSGHEAGERSGGDGG